MITDTDYTLHLANQSLIAATQYAGAIPRDGERLIPGSACQTPADEEAVRPWVEPIDTPYLPVASRQAGLVMTIYWGGLAST
jgi:hypothetical protein